MKDLSIAALSVGATALGLGIWGLSPITNAHSPHNSPQARQEARELLLDRELDISAGGQLDLDVGDGDVVVRAHDGNGARVRVYVTARDGDWGREVFRRMNFQVSASGNRASVEADNPHIDRDEWQAHRSFSVVVEVDVPRQLDVDIVTSDGDVTLTSLEGLINVETMDGDIGVEHLRGSEITLRSQDGDIWAESLTAPTIGLFTSDGDIRVSEADGGIRATTSDGDITVSLLSAATTVLRSGDGDISIRLGTFGSDIDLRGESVVVPSSRFDGERRERWARGRLNGGGPTISAQTGDGDVVVRVGG